MARPTNTLEVGQIAQLNQNDVDYFFERGIVENPRFWCRFGGKPDFANKVVGEVGCGHGSLCVDMALTGAKKVFGFDVDLVYRGDIFCLTKIF